MLRVNTKVRVPAKHKKAECDVVLKKIKKNEILKFFQFHFRIEYNLCIGNRTELLHEQSKAARC